MFKIKCLSSDKVGFRNAKIPFRTTSFNAFKEYDLVNEIFLKKDPYKPMSCVTICMARCTFPWEY